MTDAPPIPIPADATLLCRYRRTRDEDAFARLISRHAAAVRSAALRATGDSAAAEDVAQAAFLVLLGRLGPASRSARLRGSLRPWLLKTARHCASNWRRSEDRRRRRERIAAVPERVDPSEPGELGRQVAAALASLRRRDRRLIELRHLDGLAWPDVAARLSLDPAAARVAGGRALGRLRSLLERRGITAASATVVTALSSLTVRAASRPSLPSPTAFLIARGTLTMLKTQIAALTVAAGLIALAGIGGALHLAAAQPGDAGGGIAPSPSAVAGRPATRPADPEPANDPLPYELGATLSDGTSVRLVAVGDGVRWWTPTGEVMPDFGVDPDLLPDDFEPSTRPAAERLERPSGPDVNYVPTVAVVDLVGDNVSVGSAGAAVAEFAYGYGSGARVTASPLAGGARLTIAGRAQSGDALITNLRIGVGERRTLIETTFDAAGGNRVEDDGFGSLTVTPARKPVGAPDPRPTDGLVLSSPYSGPGEPREAPLQEVVVEWLTDDGFVAGTPTDHPSTIERFLTEGGSLFYTFSQPAAHRPPEVRVFARPAETVNFWGVPMAPGGTAHPAVTVR